MCHKIKVMRGNITVKTCPEVLNTPQCIYTVYKPCARYCVDYDSNANWRGHHQDAFGIVELFVHVKDCGQIQYQILFIAVALLSQANCTRYKLRTMESVKKRDIERR